MRRIVGASLAVVLAAGLATAALGDNASERRATKRWDRILIQNGPGGELHFKVKTRNSGKPKVVTRLEFDGLNAKCPASEPQAQTLTGSRRFRAKVNGRKFKVRDQTPTPPGHRHSYLFKGKFDRNFYAVRGKLQVYWYFPPENPPEETCVSKKIRYVALPGF